MSQEHTIQTIITALNETEERPRGQIAAIVRALGEEQALAVLVEANEVERTGGMMLPDGSRRRTPGGVFFALARRRLRPEQRDAIFPKSPAPNSTSADPNTAAAEANVGNDSSAQPPATVNLSSSSTDSNPIVPRTEAEKPTDTGAHRPDRRNVRLIRPGEPPRSRSETLRLPFGGSPSVDGASINAGGSNGVAVSSAASANGSSSNGASANGTSSVVRAGTAANGTTLNGGATANGAAGHAPQPSSSASEAEKGEVKLVRLDRRRIVTLPPPKPEEPRASAPRPRPERSAPTKERVSESSKSSSVESVRTSIESARTSAFESEKSERGYRVPAGLDLAVQRAQAKKRVSAVLSELSVEQQRFVLLDLLAEITNELPPLPAATADDPKLRGRILAAVGNRLGISLGQLATTIFGEDTPSNRRRVKALSGEETD